MGRILDLENMFEKPKLKVFNNTYKINDGITTVMCTMSNLEEMERLQKELEEISGTEEKMIELFVDNVIYSLEELILFDEDQDKDYFFREVEKLNLAQMKMLLETVVKIASGQEVN